MQVRYEMELPQPESFYTKDLRFDVKVDSSACGSFSLNDTETFELRPPTLLASALAEADGTEHAASLEAVSLAALRFLRTGDIRAFLPAEYASIVFLTRYHWGLAFQESTRGSVKHMAASLATFHSEAVNIHTEQFAYGLAVHFVATLLGIPIDRFFFISKSGARPDFRTRVTAVELSSRRGGSVGALSASGYIVELEVKARTGWASYRAAGRQGLELLYDLSKKASTRADRVFISVIVSLPGKNQSRETRTRVIVADPGEPMHLDQNEQAILLLEESLPLLVRHGLWPTLASVIDWLHELRGAYSEAEGYLLEYVKGHQNRLQYPIIRKDTGGRRFNGRIFSDVVLRLGHISERDMTQKEAHDRLEKNELGRAWFSGVDQRWIDIVQARDLEGLLQYGVRQGDSQELTAKSAFILEEEPMSEEIREAILRELKNALRRW